MIICLSIVLPQLAAYSNILSLSSKNLIALSKSYFFISSHPRWLSRAILLMNLAELPLNYHRQRLNLTVQRYSTVLSKVTTIHFPPLAFLPLTIRFSLSIAFLSVMRCLLLASDFPNDQINRKL